MQLRGAAKLTARLPHGAMRNGHGGLRCGAGLGHAGDLLRLRGLRHSGGLLLRRRGLRLGCGALGIDGGDVLQIHECSWVRAFSLPPMVRRAAAFGCRNPLLR